MPATVLSVTDDQRWRGQWIQTFQGDTEAHWARADLVAEAVRQYGRKGVQWASTQVRDTPWAVSLPYLRLLYRTARAFPDAVQRQADLPFSIYRIAATTDAPQVWLQRAADGAWSAEDLRRAWRTERPPRAARAAPPGLAYSRDFHRGQKAATLLADAWGADRLAIAHWGAFRAGWTAVQTAEQEALRRHVKEAHNGPRI